MKLALFTLASARSGTLFLKHVFQNNVRDCICRHEPFFDWGNPTLFGRAIYDAYAGRLDQIRALLHQKRRYIERRSGKVYLESSHAFLKSAFVAALDVFPELRLIHLIRDPIKVARSEAYREEWRRRVHAPFHYYTGDDHRRHFVWALTGNEKIFAECVGTSLTRFQWYLLQWIEIENRAMRFLAEHRLHDRCFTLHVPEDLNNAARIGDMFDFFGLTCAHPGIRLSGRKNRSLGYTVKSLTEEKSQLATVIARLPRHYLEIFQREPYCHQPWCSQLRAPDAGSAPRCATAMTAMARAD